MLCTVRMKTCPIKSYGYVKCKHNRRTYKTYNTTLHEYIRVLTTVHVYLLSTLPAAVYADDTGTYAVKRIQIPGFLLPVVRGILFHRMKNKAYEAPNI